MHEIDNPIFTAEGDRRLGALLRQRHQTITSAPGENEGDYLMLHYDAWSMIYPEGNNR